MINQILKCVPHPFSEICREMTDGVQIENNYMESFMKKSRKLFLVPSDKILYVLSTGFYLVRLLFFNLIIISIFI